MKKLFLVSFFALLSLCASAYDFEVDGICYNITGSNTVEVTEGREIPHEYAGDIVIPNKVIYDSKEYSVTRIGDYTFAVCYRLTSIDIPASVTSIGVSAFANCYRLTSINLSEGVTNIGDKAFEWCGRLTSIDIPESVTSIKESAFQNCI